MKFERFNLVVTWTARLMGATTALMGTLHLHGVLQRPFDYNERFVFLLTCGGVLFFLGLLNIIVSGGLRVGRSESRLVSLISSVFVLLFCLSLVYFFKSTLNYILITVHMAYFLIWISAGLILFLKRWRVLNF